MTQISIPLMQFRGGSSKGLYFLASDLPEDEQARDQLLIAAMGADPRQIDGLGGAHPLTSKVAIVSLSSRDDADIDYLFVQVVVGANLVDTSPNCGNILAGVVPFAIESGLVIASSPTTTLTVHMLNTGKLCEVEVCTPDGKMTYKGEAQIDGVIGSSAPVLCNYLDIAGALCGKLLPTGNQQDEALGIQVTCIDNGMPVILLRAEDLGLSGYESCDELNTNEDLKQKLEAIRLEMGPKMNLGDVAEMVVPKMCIISKATKGGIINSRTFIPHHCHTSIGVLGAVSVATACILPDSIAADIAVVPPGRNKAVSVEHPSGEFSIELEIENGDDYPAFQKASLLRTARLLSKSEVYISS